MSGDYQPWWERFFDNDNRLRWAELQNRTNPWAAYVLPWIEFARDADTNLPIVLPRLDAAHQPSWYCAGRSTQGALRLREALQAFVGPSYSDFDGRSYPLNAEDPVEAAFAEATVGPAYRIRAYKPADADRIQRALELYRGLLIRMPNQEQYAHRPLGTLRAELDRALAAGDESTARSLLERISSIGRLDAENLLYLEVEVRAKLGHWREIAEDGELLSHLTGLRLPPRVLSDVHEALYRQYIEPSEDTNNPTLALEAFRASGLNRRLTLFGTRRGLRNPCVLKAFFLYELAREDADQPRLSALARELEQVDDTFAHALARLTPATESVSFTDPLGAADDAFDNLEMDRALDLYLQVPPSRKRLTRLILCAEDIGTADAAQRVLDAIKPGDDRENLPISWSRKLDVLEQMYATNREDNIPQGWLEWARRVDAGMREEDAMHILREHMATWDSAALTSHKDSVGELVSIINNATGSAESVFREATPLLYQSLISDSGTPPRQAKPLLQILITKVTCLTDPSQNELDLTRDVAAILLLIGLEEKEYTSLVSDLEDLMGAQMSIFTLGWALDLADLLAIHACPAPETRLRLVLRVVQMITRLAHRLSQSDILLTKQLCRDNSIDCPVELTRDAITDDSSSGQELIGKRIGIYTLEEQAGQRAALILVQICPTVHVELNSDHECTKKLISLASNSDIFVFAWKSSTHQAFYCIKDHRDTAAPLIQPKGKGTSSILRAILERA